MAQTVGPGSNLDQPLKECQCRGDDVDRRQERVLASVWGESTIGRILHKPDLPQSDRVPLGWFRVQSVENGPLRKGAN